MIVFSLLGRRQAYLTVALIWACFIAAAPSLLAQVRQAPAHVNVVALMVEFQPDTTRFTTGNGTFDGTLFEGVASPRIDLLPHNQSYFEAHLSFLEDYVQKVSDHRTDVSTYVLPERVRLSKKMGAYSPTGLNADSDAELSKLAAMVHEAWMAADAKGLRLPAGYTSENTAFVLFHAGVGRDIELVGTTLDKTPEDLPSLFFSQSVMDRLGVGTPSLGGVSVNNTMVIPRTESRLGYNVIEDAPFLIELSINGLLAASFLNYLGVPDLFNTKTGESAIGPFDVMDALGIFAFGGLFPPEPSAWTKMYLGWADVTEYQSASDQQISLTHSGDATKNEVAKVFLSDSEYFLVENRHRDPENDGVHLKVWRNGVIEDVSFPNADPEFNDVTIAGFQGGVVVSVDQYDFALPGGEDEFSNPLLGGALIWHIDENRLRTGLESNSVNADPNKRGIDLEEADGAQDIGFASVGGGFFGPQYNLGSPFDFWFASNPVSVRTLSGRDIQLYQNRFSSDTYPSSHTNNGSPSQVEMSDFSDPALIITFRLDQLQPAIWQASEHVRLAEKSELDLSNAWFAGVESDQAASFPVVFGATELPGYQVRSSGWSTPGLLQVEPIVTPFGVVVLAEHELRVIQANGEIRSFDVPLASSFQPTSNLNWYRNGDQVRVRFGATAQGKTYLVHATVTTSGISSIDQELVNGSVNRIVGVSRNSSEAFFVMGDRVVKGVSPSSGAAFSWPNLTQIQGRLLDFAVSGNDWIAAYASETTPELSIQHSDGSSYRASIDFREMDRSGEACRPTKAVFGDATLDSRANVIVGCGNKLYVFHDNGVLVSGFPMSFDTDIISNPVVESNRSTESVFIYVQTAAGNLDGIRVLRKNERINGFPLALGAPSGLAPFVAADGIWTYSAHGTATKWTHDAFSIGNVRNSTELDVALSINGDSQPGPVDSKRLLVKEETYNWPNPATAGSTNIRFETSDQALVDILITDMAGGFIDEFKAVESSAGRPSEIKWVTNAQSGVYLARITARSTDGKKSDTRLIKMAIVR